MQFYIQLSDFGNCDRELMVSLNQIIKRHLKALQILYNAYSLTETDSMAPATSSAALTASLAMNRWQFWQLVRDLNLQFHGIGMGNHDFVGVSLTF